MVRYVNRSPGMHCHHRLERTRLDPAIQWRGVSVQFADGSPRSGNNGCKYCIGTVRVTLISSRNDEDGCAYGA